jgi:hypothetical protein
MVMRSAPVINALPGQHKALAGSIKWGNSSPTLHNFTYKKYKYKYSTHFTQIIDVGSQSWILTKSLALLSRNGFAPTTALHLLALPTTGVTEQKVHQLAASCR